MLISPARADVFADGGKTPDPAQRTYSDVMREKRLAQEGVGIMRCVAKCVFIIRSDVAKSDALFLVDCWYILKYVVNK